MNFRRRKKLVRPGLQLRLAGTVVGIATLGILLQFLLMNRGLMAEAKEIPGAGGMLVDRIPGATFRALLGTIALVVPLLTIASVWMTFRIVGPLVRFEHFMRAVAAGTQVDPCNLRQGDDLQDFCELLNLATERERTAAAERAAELAPKTESASEAA